MSEKRFTKQYDKKGNLISIKDDRGFFIYYTYDDKNNLIETKRSSFNLPIKFVYEKK